MISCVHTQALNSTPKPAFAHDTLASQHLMNRNTPNTTKRLRFCGIPAIAVERIFALGWLDPIGII